MADTNEPPTPIASAPEASESPEAGRQILVPDPRVRANYGDYDENGVDLSLLRYMLQLSPLERVTIMERHARDTLALLDYGRRHRETKAGHDR
jgi:hypothetical protein